MTDQTRSEREDLVERLVRLADEGPEIPAGGEDRVRAHVRPLWEREVRARRIRRASFWTAGTLALAAMIALVLLAPPLRREPPPSSVAPAAFIEVVSGQVEVDPPGGGSSRSERDRAERAVEAGSALRTGADDRASLRLVGGATLRMDRGTSLRLRSARVVELDRGAVYIDSGEAGPVEVRTALGTARDIGTQFEVRSERAALRVNVRRGLVSVQPRDGGAMTVEGGAALTVGADGSRSTSSISASAEAWNWTLAVATRPDIEGLQVAALLDWISSETGSEIRYENKETERFAQTVILHGSLGGLRPDQAAEVILPSAGLSVERQPGALVVRMTR